MSRTFLILAIVLAAFVGSAGQANACPNGYTRCGDNLCCPA